MHTGIHAAQIEKRTGRKQAQRCLQSRGDRLIKLKVKNKERWTSVQYVWSSDSRIAGGCVLRRPCSSIRSLGGVCDLLLRLYPHHWRRNSIGLVQGGSQSHNSPLLYGRSPILPVNLQFADPAKEPVLSPLCALPGHMSSVNVPHLNNAIVYLFTFLSIANTLIPHVVLLSDPVRWFPALFISSHHNLRSNATNF